MFFTIAENIENKKIAYSLYLSEDKGIYGCCFADIVNQWDELA